ncbi:MAG: hypothetical protein DI536_15075 [Archangium gephyra]|uniref:Uncharacterized protein n=1 Tax=Archangium gephyra TaxID=48 RepID=A0A2W5T9N5_9BACT|nr:MAG: hypothetical protein DI536_15075 [Archangium gephyra]
MSSDEETRELRAALEKSQQENRELRSLLAGFEALNPRQLLERIDALENEKLELRVRLERADEVRAEWDARVHGLRRELEIALREQVRLRHVLDNERLTR